MHTFHFIFDKIKGGGENRKEVLNQIKMHRLFDPLNVSFNLHPRIETRKSNVENCLLSHSYEDTVKKNLTYHSLNNS